MTFGQWLKRIRDEKTWNQRNLMMASGLSSFTITKAESVEAPNELSASTLQKLAGAYRQEPDVFVRMWKEGKNFNGEPLNPDGVDVFKLTEDKKWERVEELANAFHLEPADVVKHFKKLAAAQAKTRRIGATEMKGGSATPLRNQK